MIFSQDMRRWLLVMVMLCMNAQAQMPALTAPQGLPSLQDVSVEEYRHHLDQLRALVADCGRVVTACNPDSVGHDDRVHPLQGQPYLVRYGWLRMVLDDRDPAAHRSRTELLAQAEQRLSEQEEELYHPKSASPLREEDRVQRDRVLTSKEFQVVHEYSWRERVSAWLSEKLARIFGGAASLGRVAPWLGKVLEWGSLLAAITLLVLWIYRALDRQRTALGKLTGDVSKQEAIEASRAWAEKAQVHATNGEWRDAVHCLYWATIVLLEERRTLRRSETRTPREALQLLVVSPQLREPLIAQTVALERIWYGFAHAAQEDYEVALQNYRRVRGIAMGAAA
jgi:tetratricopeptide (TPR) repeat protein